MSREEQSNPQNKSKSSEVIKLSCRFCGSTNVIKRGKRKTENRGKIQRYLCKDCDKRFVLDDGFFRMRNSTQKITYSLDAYFRGFSLRKLQENLDVFHRHNCHYSTILRWIRKYSLKVGKFVDELPVKNSQTISFDEVEMKTKGRKSWFIDVMDTRTRYMLSSGFFYSRGEKEFNEVLRLSKNKSTNETLRFETDGLNVYPRVLRKVYNYKKHSKKFTHKVTKSTDKSFNWKIERLHGSVRERTKIMRQFGSLHSAKAIMKGFEIYYNFCRKHQGIKCFPYELAIPDLKLGKNKWAELIKLASA